MPNSPIAPIGYIQPHIQLRRTRRLESEGEVLVSLGQAVQANDAIARSTLGGGHLMLDAAKALGLSAPRAQREILRQPGETVEPGDILAGQRKVGARQLRTPLAGTIAAISEGQVLLQISDDRSLLPARVPGQVVAIQPGYGATIEFRGAWVQAVWGNRQLAEGVLHIVGLDNQATLTADLVDMSLRGAVLVAGRCEHAQSLELAAQVPVRGLVLGSLATHLGPVAAKMPYPIVLIEGFGSTAMNSEAFGLLSELQSEIATVNAQKPNPANGERPEVLIPLKDAGIPPEPLPPQSFRAGQTVRVMVGPQKGLLGEILSIALAGALLPNGLRTTTAELVLEDGSQIRAPLVNLELLG